MPWKSSLGTLQALDQDLRNNLQPALKEKTFILAHPGAFGVSEASISAVLTNRRQWQSFGGQFASPKWSGHGVVSCRQCVVWERCGFRTIISKPLCD